MKDALDNEIVIGQKYGYSAKDTVFIGIAENFTQTGRVTLRTIKRRTFLYGKEDLTWSERWPVAPTVSVPSFHLFPIAESYPNELQMQDLPE